jgi:hypothetical protein
MKKESPCKKCGCVEDRSKCSRRCQLLADYRKTIKSDGGCWQPFSSIVPGSSLGSRRIMPTPRYVVEGEDYY